ncbi:MAG TPA: Pvc16 family protein [Gemmatimonadaceae bacterium]|nr:Pvc16 family protein [Gemmatimonadaceae bacterium]
MIKDLSLSLKAMLTGEAAAGSELKAATISLGAPDSEWRGMGNGLVLDVYLYQVSENRELRTNERRVRPNADGSVTVERAPSRVECAYVVSAWSFAAVNGGGAEPEEQEQRLLSQALAVLLRNPELPRTYLTGLAVQEMDLPVVTAQPGSGIGTSGDYWSSFETHLRPTIDCRVTVALDLRQDVTGPMVTTARVQYAPDESLFLIGGVVRSSVPPSPPIAGAWVRAMETGRTAVTDAMGRFVVDRVSGGPLTLAARAVGFQEGPPRIVNVPQEPDGLYDLTLTPL